jgi:outer membrane protein TolC
MSSRCGQTPRTIQNPSRVLSRVHTGRFALFCLSFSLFAVPANAQQDIPLTLAAAEDLAIDQEPGRDAMLAQAEALDAESVAVGQLPELKLRMGIANFPIQSGGFTTEGMTQAQLGLRMEFPPGGVLDASSRQFESLAVEMRENADGRGRDVLTAVRRSWLDTYYWQRTHAIVDEVRPFFADLATVTRSLYSVGRKDQQDLLRAELELSRLDDRLIEISNQHSMAIAALSEWVGRDASRPVAEKLPEWQVIPPLASMQSNLLEHPSLKAANARIDAKEARIDVAEEDHKSGWVWDLGYGYRDGYLPDGSSRPDFVSLSVTMDLPFFKDERQGRRLSAAFSERRAAEASKEELLRRLNSRLEAEYARWTELSRRIDLYEEQILTQASANAQASLVAYQSDAADFSNVMRAYIDDLNARVEHTRLQVDRAKSFASLANLGGIPR